MAAKATTNIRISPMEERHTERVADIEKASQTSPWSVKSFQNEVGKENSIFVVAENKGQVFGYAGLWMVMDEAHIINVAIDPEHRREKLGERLIVHILKEALEQGATCATLEVRVGNEAAIGLYSKLGFTECGRRKKYYPDNKEDALVMWLYHLNEWTPPGE